MAKCQNPPLFRYTWPGKDEAYACLEHAQQLITVAAAIGLHLQMIQLNNDDQMKVILSHANCNQEVSEDA